jgi:LysM repeat protein
MQVFDNVLLLTTFSFFTFFLLHTNAAPSTGRFSRQSPRDPCPTQCGPSGSSPANWTVYHSLDTLNRCNRPLLLDFVLGVPLDQSNSPRIRACSVWGDPVPSSNTNATSSEQQFLAANGTLERIQLEGVASTNSSSSDAARALSHVQKYIQSAAPGAYGNSILFAKQGQAAVGYFGGNQLDNQYMAESVMGELIRDTIVDDNSTILMEQLCGTDRNAQQTWGIAVAFGNGNSPLSAAQIAVHTWSQGSCVAELSVLKSLANSSSNSFSNSTLPIVIYSTESQKSSSGEASDLQRRDECSTVQVVSGDSCAALAERCGITAAEFTEYNSDESLCSTLTPGQHVCCSSGTLPDFSPQPNEDGSCATYTIVADDSCSAIAAANDLTVDEIESFNSEAWGKNFCLFSLFSFGLIIVDLTTVGWNGCDTLWVGTIMCLSTGDPPMPAPLDNAVCGPQVPGTEAPTNGTALADLNPCPLNACCDIVSLLVPRTEGMLLTAVFSMHSGVNVV